MLELVGRVRRRRRRLRLVLVIVGRRLLRLVLVVVGRRLLLLRLRSGTMVTNRRSGDQRPAPVRRLNPIKNPFLSSAVTYDSQDG